jgi:purine-binding chemotaxis protein CheW
MPLQENDNQYLAFVMRDENYAIPISNVREVLTVPKITRIPRMPDFVRGVINLRGSVVPVLDLQMRFGLGSTAQTDETSIIVTEIPDPGESGPSLRIGILADAVKKVFTIAGERVEPAPKIGMAVNTAFIDGIGRIDDAFIVLLNTGEMLTREDRGLLDAAGETAEPSE